MYQVRRVNIGKTPQLDELAHACGELYSKTLVFFWRTVRHKGIWLKKKHLQGLFTSPKLHAHTSDACVEAFFAALKSWRERRDTDPKAKPPHKRKWYFRIEYKRSAMRLKDGILRLSNGKGNEPLVLDWPWQLPQTVVIGWTGTQYEAIATYKQERAASLPQGQKVAGIDLGEIHMAVSHDGEQTHILNGRLLRSKVQYRNKLIAELDSKSDRQKKGSKRRKRLIRSKKKQLKKLEHQIKDLEHKQTTRLITTLHERGVQTVVIGDVRDIRQENDVGSTNNQKIHQWSHGSVRFKLTYKAERLGMQVALQEESYTSRTCPRCLYVRSSVKGRVFCCPNCRLPVSQRWSGSHQHQAKVSGSSPSSWSHGTSHGSAVSSACPRSSWKRGGYVPPVATRNCALLRVAQCHKIEEKRGASRDDKPGQVGAAGDKQRGRK
jgi:putative transposase